MERRIRIEIGDRDGGGPAAEWAAILAPAGNRTADLIWEALPIEGNASIWGDEIYFAIPVRTAEEEAREVVEAGDLGYWPPGHAFCIFYGPTPVSRQGEIRPASPVNVFGRLTDREALEENWPRGLKGTPPGVRVRIRRA